MSLQRLTSTHTLQVVRATTADGDYKPVKTWADHGPLLNARIQDQTTLEASDGRDTTTTFKVATIAGWADVKPDDRLRDGQARVYEIDGDPTFDQAPGGRLKMTVLRLRVATNL